jgi:hypothetical protein
MEQDKEIKKFIGGADYVKMRALEVWNGVLPTYVGGAMPFINVN